MATATVLLIEDAPDLLMLYKRYLAGLDVEIKTAESGAQALDLLKKHKPHILLMDLTLKDMSTADFYEKFIEIPGIENVHKILVSGREDLASWADLFGAGQFFRKPVDREKITTAVKSYL